MGQVSRLQTYDHRQTLHNISRIWNIRLTVHFVYLPRVPKYVVLCRCNTAVAMKSGSNNDELCRDFGAVFRFRCKLLQKAALQNGPLPPQYLPNVWRSCASELIRNRKQATKMKKIISVFHVSFDNAVQLLVPFLRLWTTPRTCFTGGLTIYTFVNV